MHENARECTVLEKNAPADQHTRRKRSLVMAKAAPTSEKSAKSDKETVRPVQKEVPQPAQPPRDPARDSALTRAVQQIEKQFGKGAVMRMDGDRPATIDGIATGSLSLDIALGGAGGPRGRVIEIFGPESSGKTTLTLHIIGSAQH